MKGQAIVTKTNALLCTFTYGLNNLVRNALTSTLKTYSDVDIGIHVKYPSIFQSSSLNGLFSFISKVLP